MSTPGTSEADEELEALLKEQAAFLKSGKAAAAKVTRTAAPSIGGRRQSRPPQPEPYLEQQLPVLNPEVVMQKPPTSKMAARTERAACTHAAAEAAAQLLPPVLSDIREREPSVGAPMPPFQPAAAAARPPPRRLPRAAHRSTLSAAERDGCASCLPRTRRFCQRGRRQCRRRRALVGNRPWRGRAGPLGRSGHSHGEHRPAGQDERWEIAKAQKELLASLDPNLVAKIRQRQQQPKQPQQPQQPQRSAARSAGLKPSAASAMASCPTCPGAPAAVRPPVREPSGLSFAAATCGGGSCRARASQD